MPETDIKNQNAKSKNAAENTEGKEVRTFTVVDAELRIDEGEQQKIIGYATKYGNFYPVYDFDERILAGAFDEVLADDNTDVIASFNHNVDYAFARQSAGTLRLVSNTIGLMYEADVTDDDGRMVRDKILAKTIKGSSFMFSDVDDDWSFKDGERPKRTIKKVRNLYELGPVIWPANTKTTVKARADEILAEARARSLEKAKEQDTGHRTQDIDKSDEERATSDELTFDQKFEIGRAKRRFERLDNRLKKYKQAEA